MWIGYIFFFQIFLLHRTVVNGILAQVASNLKTSCEVTDEAFSKRLDEVKHAKGKLENQKAETIVKIQEVTKFPLKRFIIIYLFRLTTLSDLWSKP